MRTTHRLARGDARALPLPDGSIDLVVTSPPYPGVAMWDPCFTEDDPGFAASLANGDAVDAFERAHAQLDACWRECRRVLTPGGLLCVNVGDATRTVGGAFSLWPNHARILLGAQRAGFTPLPDVLWRKPTNAPNKFMGSGMLPAGAYVTYEHEYVLVLRNGGPRRFDPAGRARRAASAYFWEERNLWFSDLWSGIAGERQGGADARRSGAFPLEIPWRLIHMYSLGGDRVLDPYAGTGTTALAALAAGRSSVGFDRAHNPADVLRTRLPEAWEGLRRRADGRLDAHLAWLRDRPTPRHTALQLGVPVTTRQEQALRIWRAEAHTWDGDTLHVDHGPVERGGATG